MDTIYPLVFIDTSGCNLVETVENESVSLSKKNEGEAEVVARHCRRLLAAGVRMHYVQVETHALEGEPADALLKVAEKVGASMIVVGNRGMHGAKRMLGSVPNAVSHNARCNVLIVSTA